MVSELTNFLLVVDHGTFTEAARRAHLAQPSLSASIRRLEEDMGARLLERLPRGARPTAAGEALIPHARGLLAGLDRARRAVREVEGLEAGEVRLGGGATASTYLLPPLLASFRDRHPGLRLRLTEAFTPQIPEMVRRGELDLGIAQGVGETWLIDELVLVSAPDYSGQALIGFVRGAAMRTEQDRLFPDWEQWMALASIAAVKGQVRAGLGVALLSRAACQTDLAEGRLVVRPHPGLPLRRELGLVHAGVERLSPAAKALREHLLWDRTGG